jgi:DNA helicase-2/ATP-dependent DNA helicase PcrA
MSTAWTSEQEVILNHTSGHGRIQAGPGTGKSTTVIALAGRLADGRDEGAIRLATFTRAATGELATKALEGDVPVEVTTVHSFALRILVHNPQWSRLPLPLRIPDEWENDNLIHEDLRVRLARRWHGLRRTTIERLEREMAAQWESMDDTRLIADIDPDLRDAYLAAWRKQRTVFGYSLFAEMPWYALELIEDHEEADLLHVECLIVDEYQDLNRCEVRLLRALADRGVDVVSVGDEDQSIYGWRMAAPEGIRHFTADFPGSIDYTLSVSQRCARRILDAAQCVIAIAPGRDAGRPRLSPADHNSDGILAYLRFPSAQAERRSVVRLLRHHHDSDEVPYARMAILMRNDYQGRWSRPLKEELDNAGVPYTDVEAALEPLHTDDARELLAVARLALNPSDDLAWWTLLKVRRGVADASLRAIADFAWDNDRRFGEQLLRLSDDDVPGLTTQSAGKAISRINEVRRVVEQVERGIPEGANWVEWLREVAAALEIPIADDLDVLMTRAAEGSAASDSIREVLAQLEPIARDIALESPGVHVMSVSRSKGLTFDVVAAIGVEEELYPSPLSDDPEEDRRLLYVAITRARYSCYLTMANTRNDGTAFSGRGDSIRSRSRCQFLSVAGIHPTNGFDYLSSRAIP